MLTVVINQQTCHNASMQLQFTANVHEGTIKTSYSIQQVYKKRSGHIAVINSVVDSPRKIKLHCISNHFLNEKVEPF